MNQIIEVYKEGNNYYEQLLNMDLDKLKLGSEVIFNLICISCESFLSALLLKHNDIIEHGSISSMLRAASKHLTVSDELMNDARFMNRFHTWCALDAIPSKQANSEELKRMVGAVTQIHELVKCNLYQ